MKNIDREFMMRIAVLTFAAVAVAVQADLVTQSRDSLVGTWTLVSASASTADGRLVDAPFGSNPTGVVTYTREGRITGELAGMIELELRDAFAVRQARGLGSHSVRCFVHADARAFCRSPVV